MDDFFNILADLIQKYTIADTASVFSIIGGIATVIAAIGAIIAVVVTKRIAKEQIEIAKKQNEISDKQADIAKQQNCIALYHEREDTFNHLLEFFSCWKMYRLKFANNDSSKYLGLTKSAIDHRARSIGIFQLDSQNESINYSRLLSQISIIDIKYLWRVKRMFLLNNNFRNLLDDILEKYSDFHVILSEILNNDPDQKIFTLYDSLFFKLLLSDEINEMITNIESQMHLLE